MLVVLHPFVRKPPRLACSEMGGAAFALGGGIDRQRVRALDFSDDRLAALLAQMGDRARWQPFEQEPSSGLLRVYDLSVETVRLDATTAKWGTEKYSPQEGWMTFGTVCCCARHH